MKNSILAPIGAMMALGLSMPAMAQDSGGAVDWTGPYVGGSFGYNWQKSDGAEHLRFDTDGDGSYDDAVTTTTGANAFSPGTCGGAARAGHLAAARRRARRSSSHSSDQEGGKGGRHPVPGTARHAQDQFL